VPVEDRSPEGHLPPVLTLQVGLRLLDFVRALARKPGVTGILTSPAPAA
jgi:hypothetical protein